MTPSSWQDPIPSAEEPGPCPDQLHPSPSGGGLSLRTQPSGAMLTPRAGPLTAKPATPLPCLGSGSVHPQTHASSLHPPQPMGTSSEAESRR